jgi:hypothetical protein
MGTSALQEAGRTLDAAGTRKIFAHPENRKRALQSCSS